MQFTLLSKMLSLFCTRKKMACQLIPFDKTSRRLKFYIFSFFSIPDIGKVMFNFRVLRWIPTWFYKNQFFSKTKILKVTTSVLFISGLMDGLIPPSMMNGRLSILLYFYDVFLRLNFKSFLTNVDLTEQ